MNANGGTRRIVGAMLVAGLAQSTTACGDDPDPIGTGTGSTALLVLETPNIDEGALLFEIEGPGVPTVETVSASHRLFTHETTGDLRIALIGDLAAGGVLTVEIAEGTPEDYSVTLEQVADRQNRLRSGLSAYELRIEPIGD